MTEEMRALETVHPEKFKVGARVIVVMKDELCFDDYEVGDTATIIGIREPLRGYIMLRVKWDVVRYPDDERKEACRCDTLYAYEAEPMPASQ